MLILIIFYIIGFLISNSKNPRLKAENNELLALSFILMILCAIFLCLDWIETVICLFVLICIIILIHSHIECGIISVNKA